MATTPAEQNVMKTDKKIVLVTGANQGLGLSIIYRTALLEPGSLYILCSRDLEKGNEAKGSLVERGVKAEILVVKFDVCDDVDLESLVKMLEDLGGKLDVLVHNAGISPLAHPPTSTASRAIRTAYTTLLNTNLVSPYVLTKTFLPFLHKAKNPKVVFITSGLASLEFNLKEEFVRGKRSVEYGTSKTGLNGLCVHFQAAENDRVEVDWKGRGWAATGQGEDGEQTKGLEGYVRFWTVQPGILRTALTGFREGLKDPDDGAEVAVRLIADEQEGGKYYLGGTYWKCDVDTMEEVSW